ncbi:MAG: hypothetical protein AAF488_03450 [Planctomycetota bacterium]
MSRNGEGPEASSRNRPRRARFTWLKHAFVYAFYWTSRITPRPLVRGALSLLASVFRVLRRVPGNPIRRGCDDLAAICTLRGHPTTGREVYSDFIRQLRDAACMFHEVYFKGPEHAAALVDFPAEDHQRVLDAIESHGGLMAAVPHNVTASLAGIGFSQIFPTLLIGKNGDAAWRETIAKEAFSRLGIEPLFVRGKSALKVSRTMIEAMTRGKVAVATIDNIYRKPNRVEAEIFGGTVGFSPWAVRLAATAKVPVMPAFMYPENGRIRFETAEPLLSDDVEALTQHCIAFFEEQILRHPSCWGFIGHKRWRMVLRQARQRLESQPELIGTPFEVRSSNLRRREETPAQPAPSESRIPG